MNTEIEVRLLDINKDELINKLNELKAKYIGSFNQIRYCYDFNPKKDNKWIRLRTNGIKSTLTKELEIEVSSFSDTDKILEQLGYKKRSIQENHRIQYILNNVEIDIDDWPMLNTFVEFEAKSINDIKRVFKLLKLDYSKSITDNVEDIYLSKGYTKKDLNNLKF